MADQQNKRTLCAICNLPFGESELLEHYRSDLDLLAYTRRLHKGIDPGVKACAKCLERIRHEMDNFQSSVVSDMELSGEKTVITPQEQSENAAVESDQVPCLLVIHGTSFAKKYDLTKEHFIIGRSDKADISINEENVSRQHARVTVGKNEVIVEDLESTNGTFVNTKKVPSKVLKDGDLILIGNTILKFISGSNVESLYHREIFRLATLDGLTQVFNKAFILERLAEEFRRSRRYKRELSLVMFDFDHFKSINDTYGHPAGDFILKKAASLVLRNMRKEDIFGRYGGEEFTIVFLETPIESAQKIAEKIRALIEGESFLFEGKEIKVTISVGVAEISEKVPSYKALLKMADDALYQAKRNGRNQICVAKPQD